MSDSWLDHIPSHERERIRRRLRSPEEYERLREKVKGPKDLAREMERNEAMAELRFGLETEPTLHDALRNQLSLDVQQQGIDAVIEEGVAEGGEMQRALERGKFRVTVSVHPSTHHDQLMVVPEGKIEEKLPVKPALSDRYVGQFMSML